MTIIARDYCALLLLHCIVILRIKLLTTSWLQYCIYTCTCTVYAVDTIIITHVPVGTVDTV